MDVGTLKQVQIMFCIPKETVEAAHADICGSLFEKVYNLGFIFGSTFVCVDENHKRIGEA